jgi:hypothetical protein
MANQSENPVSLEELLRLKRHEAPESEFWAGFEHEFQQRRLRKLMDGAQTTSGGVALWRRWTLLGSLSFSAVAAVVVMVVGQPASLSLIPAMGEGGLIAEQPVTSTSAAPVPDRQEGSSEVAALAQAELPDTSAASTRPWAELNPSASHFITDSLASGSDSSARFRRVLPSATLEASFAQGARYVADRISDGRSSVVSTVYRPASNF